jgi:ABC-type sugar transport system substrate-binding protein
VGPSTLDIPAMVTDIQDALTSKPDILMTCACGAGAFDAVEKKAKDQGIVVVNIAADSAPASRNLFFGTNYTKLGHNAANLLITKMNGKAHIMIVQTNGTTQNQVEEIAAFQNVIRSHPGMKIVTQIFDNSDASVAAPKMSAALAAHPDINVIWTVEGAAPGAVASVLKQAGKKPGDVSVLAIDLQVPTKQAIRQGWIWATLYQQFFDATPLAVACAIKIKEGQHVTAVWDTGALVITKTNIPTNLPPTNSTLPKHC